jgi:Mce-associated membrane protein
VTAVPNPSWYDLLGVAPDASAEEIRVAWRARIADLDPTDRRFVVLNQAAEVLLDPARRAAYDATLAPAEPVSTASTTEDARSTTEEGRPTTGPRVAVVPGWLLAGVGIVALVLVAAAAIVWVRQPSAGAVERDARAAQAAAERAVVPVLSYDARHLEESQAAAQQYLTGDYRKKYDDVFDGIIAENAPSTETVVKAELVRSSVVRASGDRVQVFLLVNQSRTNKQFTEPQVYKNWVTVTMADVDGEWLVADMTTK